MAWIWTFFSAYSPFLWHMSGATLAIIACAAWAIWMPFLKKEAIYAGITIFLTTTAYVVGVTDGKHIVKTQWDDAITRGVSESNSTRRQTDAGVPLEPDRRKLCNDPANRNPC